MKHTNSTVHISTTAASPNNTPAGYMAEIGKSTSDTEKAEQASCSKIQNRPKILIITQDCVLKESLNKVLFEEYHITFYKTLDMQEFKSMEKMPDAILIDKDIDGICMDQLCIRIRNEKEMTNVPILLLIDDNESDYYTYAECGADRLELRNMNIFKLKINIKMLIKRSDTLKTWMDQKIADSMHILPKSILRKKTNLEFIQNVRKFINKNFVTEKYTINMLCKDMGMSRTALYNKIKNITGMKPIEYIHTFKMETAARMLSSGSYNITETADLLGYCDVKYFRKIFKKHYQSYPSKYIKEHKMEPLSHTES